jgi:hypothetical protein
VKEKLTIHSEMGKIYCEVLGDKYELFLESESQFFGAFKGIGNIKGSFTEDEKGNVKNLLFDFGISKINFKKIK